MKNAGYWPFLAISCIAYAVLGELGLFEISEVRSCTYMLIAVIALFAGDLRETRHDRP